MAAAIFENSNGDRPISAIGHVIHIMFVSVVGFSGSASPLDLFPIELNPRGHLGIFGMNISLEWVTVIRRIFMK